MDKPTRRSTDRIGVAADRVADIFYVRYSAEQEAERIAEHSARIRSTRTRDTRKLMLGNDQDLSGWPGATLLILGAARCGTSSIHELFRRHPDVCASVPKEPRFFEAEYDKGLDYYRRSYFPHWRGERVVVEARALNLLLPYVSPRIKESFPEARFIVSLRDPAERAFSHWALRYSLGYEDRPFDVAIEQCQKRLQVGDELQGPDAERIWRERVPSAQGPIAIDVYLDCGHYATQLRRFFALFPRERFCIVTVDQMRSDPAQTAGRLFDFAGLDATRGPSCMPHDHAASGTGPRLLHRIDHALHLSSLVPLPWRKRLRSWTSLLKRRHEPPAQTMRWLRDYYEPYDRDLCQLLGWERCPWIKTA